MPWVKDLPLPVLAAFFQRMPVPLKRQVEMTTHQMADIMKALGWRKHHNVDVTIPVDAPERGPISVQVNKIVIDVKMNQTDDKIGFGALLAWLMKHFHTETDDDDDDVDATDLLQCVEFLLPRIRPRRFSLTFKTRAQLKAAHLHHDEAHEYGLCDAVLATLVKSKGDGVALRELQLNGRPTELAESNRFRQVIETFADTLTHLSTPELLDCDEIRAIGMCSHLKVLECDRDVGFGREFRGMSSSEVNAWKDAFKDKTSLKRLALNASFNPLKVLDTGIHHLEHLTVGDLEWLSVSESGVLSAEENVRRSVEKNLLSNLTVFASDDCFFPSDMPRLLNALGMAQKLERLHFTTLEYDDWRLGEYESEATSGYVSTLVRAFADHCDQSRRSLSFSCQFSLYPLTVSTVRAANRDDEAMVAAMMKNDKEFVTSKKLSHYAVTAYDERLFEFDDSLTPPTTEHPLHTHITSIDGSHLYKRQFKIDVRSGVRLSIAFDESPMCK